MPLKRQSSARVYLLHQEQSGCRATDAMSIAIEHVRWCRARGDSYAKIIQSVGFVPSSRPDFDEAACVLAAAASRL